jgi:predicted ribosomally synthesized peptide with SipW-like signal peptide
MKKILLLLMAVVVCVGLIGAAFAYFTDTQSSAANSFTAGTVKLTLSGDLANGISLGNMAPGDTYTGNINVTNSGTLPVWFAGYIGSYDQNMPGFINQFTVQISQVTSPTYPGSYVLVPTESFANLIGKSNALIDPDNAFAALPAGQTATYQFVITLPLATDTSFQGKTAWAKLQFDAIQSANFTFPDAAMKLKGQ